VKRRYRAVLERMKEKDNELPGSRHQFRHLVRATGATVKDGPQRGAKMTSSDRLKFPNEGFTEFSNYRRVGIRIVIIACRIAKREREGKPEEHMHRRNFPENLSRIPRRCRGDGFPFEKRTRRAMMKIASQTGANSPLRRTLEGSRGGSFCDRENHASRRIMLAADAFVLIGDRDLCRSHR